jgi:hypothetical protein
VFARSTTVFATPSAIDQGVAHVRDVLWPALRGLDGNVGLSMLVDRASGQCVITSAWRGEQELQAAQARLRPLLESTAAVLGGWPEDEDWTIAVLHRGPAAAAAACVRVTWLRIQPEQIDYVIDVYRMRLLPQICEFEGFCSASLLVDRTSGYGVSSVGFTGHEPMRHTRNLAAAVRERGAREVRAEIIEVGEFELALAHLRVPELI